MSSVNICDVGDVADFLQSHVLWCIIKTLTWIIFTALCETFPCSNLETPQFGSMEVCLVLFARNLLDFSCRIWQTQFSIQPTLWQEERIHTGLYHSSVETNLGWGSIYAWYSFKGKNSGPSCLLPWFFMFVNQLLACYCPLQCYHGLVKITGSLLLPLSPSK